MEDWRMACHYCYKEDISMGRCGRCYSVYYCSKTCQATDWHTHKANCRNLSDRHAKGKKKTTTNWKTNRTTKTEKISETDGRNHVKVLDTQFDDANVGLQGDVNMEQDASTESGEIVEELVNILYDNAVAASMKTEYSLATEGVVINNTHTGILHDGNSSTRADQDGDINAIGEEVDGKEERSKKPEGAGKLDGSESKEEDDDHDMAERRKKHGESKPRLSGGADKLGDGSERNLCAACSSPGCSQKCARCKEPFYCSKQCQKGHWVIHKGSCKKKLTEEEERILRTIKIRNDDAAQMKKMTEEVKGNVFHTGNFMNPGDRFFDTLTPHQALQMAARPVGSLAKAAIVSTKLYPLHEILTDFDDIPSEPLLPFVSLLHRPRDGYVLVAFMYRYHEHVMRHGVYLKDAQDKESKVEFYLDHLGDNPFPFFSYSQIKPGSYICLRDPVMHHFMDGSVGIRINSPGVVTVLTTDMFTRV